tara:strand:- start:3531 stop:4169 length:639 start_codon:yes stop_codon:yes gene_type:complete
MTPPVIKRKTYSEDQGERVSEIIKDILKKDYVSLKLIELQIKEEAIEEKTEIVCKFLFNKKRLTIKGTGKGPVDALFNALVDSFSDEYCSLKNLHFTRFSIEADIEKHLRYSKTDAVVEATLEIDNGCEALLFREKSSSISIVSAKVVLIATEHFINAEKCVIMLYNNIQNTKKRGRGDMMSIYTRQLAEIVKNVSYENVIQKLKEEHKNES